MCANVYYTGGALKPVMAVTPPDAPQILVIGGKGRKLFLPQGSGLHPVRATDVMHPYEVRHVLLSIPQPKPEQHGLKPCSVDLVEQLPLGFEKPSGQAKADSLSRR